MKNRGLRIVVLFGAISIVGIILFQVYWVQQVYSIKEKQLVQTINSALYNVAEKIAQYNETQLQNENPIDQYNKYYYIVNVNSLIDPNILDHYLKTEFEFQNLKIDYEYAIYDCDSDVMRYTGYFIPSQDTNALKKMEFEKCEDCIYYFGIHFPKIDNYIVGDMKIWILFSLLLLTAVIFIGVAIFVILRQRRLSEIQKDFINNMTHEFKTPISTISISADVISKPDIVKDPHRLSNYAAIIKDQNHRLESQVEKVLQFANIDKKELKLNIEEIDIHEIVLNVAENFMVNIDKKNGALLFDLDAHPSFIFADKFHVTNIIYNLLDNAVKYSHDKPRISIITKNSDSFIDLSIKDNGIGMKKDQVKKVFDKFYRVPTGNIHNVKGFGIGLNYVKSIVDAHRWKIAVDSEPEKGSIFTIHIPLKK